MPTRLCTTRAAASPLALLLLAPALRASSSNGRDARGLLDGSGTDVGGGSGSLAAAANADLATTVVELRQLWMQALRDEADAAIEVPPGSTFRLRGRPLTCRKDIRLTVFSSGAGATLDGMNESQIFKLQGCSLTLRGLTLVNGCPEAGLKAACRDQRTGRWRPYEGVGSWYMRNSVYKPECMYVVRLVRSDPGMPSHPAQGYPSASALLRTAARSMPSRRHLVPLPPWPSSR